MQGYPQDATGQPFFRQDAERLAHFSKTGEKKAEGISIDDCMQGERRFWRESGELWPVGHFRDGPKHGDRLRHDRDGSIGKREDPQERQGPEGKTRPMTRCSAIICDFRLAATRPDRPPVETRP